MHDFQFVMTLFIKCSFRSIASEYFRDAGIRALEFLIGTSHYLGESQADRKRVKLILRERAAESVGSYKAKMAERPNGKI